MSSCVGTGANKVIDTSVISWGRRILGFSISPDGEFLLLLRAILEAKKLVTLVECWNIRAHPAARTYSAISETADYCISAGLSSLVWSGGSRAFMHLTCDRRLRMVSCCEEGRPQYFSESSEEVTGFAFDDAEGVAYYMNPEGQLMRTRGIKGFDCLMGSEKVHSFSHLSCKIAVCGDVIVFAYSDKSVAIRCKATFRNLKIFRKNFIMRDYFNKVVAISASSVSFAEGVGFVEISTETGKEEVVPDLVGASSCGSARAWSRPPAAYPWAAITPSGHAQAAVSGYPSGTVKVRRTVGACRQLELLAARRAVESLRLGSLGAEGLPLPVLVLECFVEEDAYCRTLA